MDTFYKKLGQRIKKLREAFLFSQEILAKEIGISRVSLSQIENGSRNVSAEELSIISKIFNISMEVLLDKTKEINIEIIKNKVKNEDVKTKNELRISIPQKNIDKFKEVLIYILDKIGAKSNVGETVIYKLLYFIDFDFYEKYEEQLIGAQYQKNHFGPTPVEFIKVISIMKQEKAIVEVVTKFFKHSQKKYLPLRKPDLRRFKANEIKLIDEVIEKLSDMTAIQISEYSHGDVPWIITEDDKIINYESVFYRTPLYSVREDKENNNDI